MNPPGGPPTWPRRDIGARLVREQLEGRVVLVTGAGGELGRELCRQIAQHFPARVVLLDHDDQRLAMTQLELGQQGASSWDDLLLVDIRDLPSLSALLVLATPDVVVHTASLHDPGLTERYPDEAWHTNAVGTRNLLEAATHAGVGTFVTVTRAGAGPATALGRSQREAERLTASFAEEHPARYVAVRLGACTTGTANLEECARLVLEAAATGADGHVVEGASPAVGAS